MKKQILILISVFIFGVTSAFAQLTGNPTCPTPTPVNTTCISADALHPVPGTAYDYTVEVPTPTTGTKTYNWFVTQDPDFIVGSSLTTAIEINDGTGAHIQATGAGYNNQAPGGTATMNITWKSFTHDPALPVFLVIYVTNSACQTDNIEVYIIEPRHAFTLDIANIGVDGSGQANLYETCVAAVAGAQYVGGTVQMDYGINVLYFAVTAANFTDSWLPSFQIGGTGMTGSRDVVAVDWAYPAEAILPAGTWNTMTEAGTDWTTTNPIDAQGGTTVGAAGECIIVRVTVENNQAETIVNAPISLAVDGTMLDPAAGGGYTNAAYDDIHHLDCSVDGFTNDVVTQVLAPRPDINAITPTPFVPQNKD